MNDRARRTTTMALALLLTTSAVAGAGTNREEPEGGWQFELTPYLWVPAIEGNSTVEGVATNVDVSAGDVLDLVGDGFSLLSGFLHGEARNDRLFLFLDLALTRLDTDGSAEIPVANPAVRASIDATLRQDSIIAEVGGGYTLWEAGLPGHPKYLLEGFVGARYYYYWTQVKADVQARASLPIGPVRRSVPVRATDTSQWADPFLGIRWMLPITDDFFLHFRGDVGGFGLASDFAWSLNGFFRYELPWRPMNVTPSVLAGYRALSFDYDGGSDGQDLLMHGAAIGLGLGF